MATGLEKTAVDPMTGRTAIQRDQSLSFTQTAKNTLLPVNIRQFLSHIIGSREPITESQFSPEDLAAIRYAIAKRGGESGEIGYGDYGPQGRSSWMDPTQKVEGPFDIIYKSYTDPVYRMETTLGGASYRRLPDGSYLVEDEYNFNAPSRKIVLDALREQGMLALLREAFKSGGLSGILNVIGNVYGATEDEPGAPVRINLGTGLESTAASPLLPQQR